MLVPDWGSVLGENSCGLVVWFCFVKLHIDRMQGSSGTATARNLEMQRHYLSLSERLSFCYGYSAESFVHIIIKSVVLHYNPFKTKIKLSRIFRKGRSYIRNIFLYQHNSPSVRVMFWIPSKTIVLYKLE